MRLIRLLTFIACAIYLLNPALAKDNASTRKPDYYKYVTQVSSSASLAPERRQSYELIFVTPALRKQSRAYISEQNQEAMNLAIWDNSDLLELIVIPTIRTSNGETGTVYHRNQYMIESVTLTDKNFKTLCEPKDTILVGAEQSYIQTLYGTNGSNYDPRANIKVCLFEADCFKNKDLSILIKNFSARSALGLIDKQVVKTVLKDLNR